MKHGEKAIALLLAVILTLSLCACGAESKNAPEQSPDAQLTVQDRWSGWWYGAADVNGCENGWEWANGMVFDVVMRVDLDENGVGQIDIYDPYGDMARNLKDRNRFAVINCHADENYLYGDGGIAFGYDIKPEDWRIARNLDNNSKINVGSSYTDVEGNKFGYDFTFIPWGDRWEKDEHTESIPHYEEYIACLDAGDSDPLRMIDEQIEKLAEEEAEQKQDGQELATLDVNGRGVIFLSYPADRFVYDEEYGCLKNEVEGVSIYIDPMLGEANFEEMKASYEAHNSQEADYSLLETIINGDKALVMTYSDLFGYTMRVDIDFGEEHDGFYGISFSIKADTLEKCDGLDVWNIIGFMQVKD